MKKYSILPLLLCLSFFCRAQFSLPVESEPNDDISNANGIDEHQTTSASLGGGDQQDYFGLDFNKNAGFYVVLDVSNTGSDTRVFHFDFYNSLRIDGDYVGNFYSGGIQLDAGSSFYDTIKVCGMSRDSIYMKFSSADGEFDYNVEWLADRPYNADDLYYGYNNNAGAALPFTFNTQTEGSLGYEFWGNRDFDTIDYYRTTIPVTDYENIVLQVNAENTICDGPPSYIRYACYKNGNPVPFEEGFVSNSTFNLPGQKLHFGLQLTGLTQGDQLTVAFSTRGTYGYDFRVGPAGAFNPDDEDNCCTYNAIPIDEGETKSGNVGDFDYDNDYLLDEYDTYRVILPHDGAIQLFVKAQNENCDQDYYTLSCDILDKDGNELQSEDLFTWDSSPDCGQLQEDVFKLRAFTADTFYLRFHSNNSYYYGKISYSFHFEETDIAESDANELYNGPYTTVLPISAGETKKGHIQFWKTANLTDESDIYHTTMPADGSVTVYLKATYRDPYDGFNNGYDRLNLISSNFSSETPNYPKVSYMTPDATYLDTLHICGLAAGDLYLTLKSSAIFSGRTQSYSNRPGFPYEYEFRYEIADTSSIDNDTEPNDDFATAILVPGGTGGTGHIHYVANVNTDQYDYYKIPYSSADSLVVPFTLVNASCKDNQSVTIKGYNKNQVELFSVDKTNIAAGQTITDVIRKLINNPDTIFLRISATAAFKYSFNTNAHLPTSAFTLVGDSTVCFGTQVYKASGIGSEPVDYHWSLPAGGGSLTYTDSVATVTWNGSGQRSIALYLSNSAGNSQVKTMHVTVDAAVPDQAPVMSNFARTLSISNVPQGVQINWYRNDGIISGAQDSSYYASLAGDYAVRYSNNCGDGPASNTITFANDVVAQTITFVPTPDRMMAPGLKIKLNATSSSGLPVFYNRISGPGTVSGDSLSITSVGTIIIKAIQPGDDTYSAATPKNDTIIVSKGNQVVTLDSIADRYYRQGNFLVQTSSSSGLNVTKTIVSGNARVAGNTVIVDGAGSITIRASQNGNSNYNAATPVERTFCVGIDTLAAIKGAPVACLGTYAYTAQKIPGANYIWTLDGGGTMTTHNDTAWITWQTTGSHIIKVKANSDCNTDYSFEPQLEVTINNVTPVPVTNMIPVNGAVDQSLPLKLSWVPGDYTETYDLYVWESTLSRPATAYKTGIQGITFTIPVGDFANNITYKWQLVSKNPCNQAEGPVQTFHLVPLPDLAVTNVSAPTTAISGQTMTITWTVRNDGTGNTPTNQSWQDEVYLNFDNSPNFSINPEVSAPVWSAVSVPARPLLVASKTNLNALLPGEQYTNSVDFAIPANYSLPVYAYVITNVKSRGQSAIQEVTLSNDTLGATHPIAITLAPSPDLQVDSLLTNGTTYSGGIVNISYKVSNHAALTPPGVSWTDAVYLSQSAIFDSTTAIPLNAPKANGSYYPNAPKAVISVNTQLQTGDAYYKTVQAVIPNNLFGTWFVHVKTNNKHTLYEGPSFGNNTNNAVVQVYLTPTPHLTINNLSVPVTSASTTQAIGVNWNIYNDGFRDNTEKNRGHYYTISTCTAGCGSDSHGRPQVCVYPYVIKDSAVFGSSFWIDRVYLSTEAGGLNTATATLVSTYNHGTENSGLYPDVQYPTACGQSLESRPRVNVDNVIESGSNFPATSSFIVPDNLPAGNYYVYVYTNPTKTVFEYPGAPEIQRSALPITISRPDIAVLSVQAPASALGGDNFIIDYTLQNSGGNLYNHRRKDRLFVSSHSSFDGSAILVDSLLYTENLTAGVTVPHSFGYKFAPGTNGTFYFFVQTNSDSSFRESSYANNINGSAAVVISQPLAADLVATSLNVADTVRTVFPTIVTYTIRNDGAASAAGTWTDSLFVSCAPVFNRNTAFYIGRKTLNRTLAVGESRTDTIRTSIGFTYDISSCFPNNDFNTAYFFVKVNGNNGVFESVDTLNNLLSSGSRILDNPLVDHIVTTVNGAATATVSLPYSLSWTDMNIGRNPGISYGSRADEVFISPDSVFNSNAISSGKYFWDQKLEHGESVSFTKPFTIANVPTGYYYVMVKANNDTRYIILAEKDKTNNVNFIRDANGAATKIFITRPDLPDLVDSIIAAPASAAAGQTITVVHRIRNIGIGAVYTDNFYLRSFVATGLVGNAAVSNVVTRGFRRALQPGEFVDDTLSLQLMPGIPSANYVLTNILNPTNEVAESNIDNNRTIRFIDIFQPDSSDLVTRILAIPDTVTLGYKADAVQWLVQNNSGVPAIGTRTDGIYLSGSPAFDSSAVLLGTANRSSTLQPLESDTLTSMPLVTNVTEGDYYVVVKTDIQDKVLETDDTNNEAVSVQTVHVKVKELLLATEEIATLGDTLRYYKLVIPDSLNGATVSVKLTSNDSLTRTNQVFIGKEYVPSAAQFDYSYPTANYGNQEIVMAYTVSGTYYIMVRCVNAQQTVQDIKLLAKKLPFSITDVDASSGGNIGNVTVKISGALFTEGMTARLNKPGTEIIASTVYFINSTSVFATFNLQGKPLGLYDVTLSKADTATAVLAEGFSVANASNGGLISGGGNNTGSGNGNESGCDPGAAGGLNSLLVTELIVPEKVLRGWPFTVQVNFRNPTNFDIPAQVLTLYAEDVVSLGLTQADADNNNAHTITITLSEPGGPPGIIRAGATGSVIIYARAGANVEPHTHTIFRLQ